MVACSVVLFLADPDEPGRGLLTAFGGLLFLTTFGWAVDAATRSDPRQRALRVGRRPARGRGARQRRPRAGRCRPCPRRCARRRADPGTAGAPARQPVPGRPRSTTAPTAWAASRTTPARNRLGIALLALFFALTGLYCSCWPSVFVLGWPFQFIASILAVVAIVRPGRGRRLGVVAAIVSVLGTLVTVGVLVWGVVEGVGS
ncbi:hypothetical protein Q9Q99_01545 [Curtobacterium flaccumfaciens]|nr:hypothetical protein Q9Q99_01545 [Curtobacterium flaccumfaciens]